MSHIILLSIWALSILLFFKIELTESEKYDTIITLHREAAIVVPLSVTTTRRSTTRTTTKAPTTRRRSTTEEPTRRTSRRTTTEASTRRSTSPTRSTSLRIDPRIGLRFGDDYYYVYDENRVDDYYNENGEYTENNDYYEQGGNGETYAEGYEETADKEYEYETYYYTGEDGEEANEEKRKRRRKRQVTACGCYAPGQCNSGGNTDGAGLIDFRIISSGNPSCSTGLTYCCPGQNGSAIPQVSCGSRITSYVNYPIETGQARYGDYPWMALIQTTNNDYVGGGVLIDYQYILTAAHKVSSYSSGTGLKVRLGEWDTSANYEQYPYREYRVSRIWIHESFNPSNLKNDIAIMRLSSVVATYPTVGIVPVCMPTASQNFEGQRCWVAGWGKDQFGASGRFQTILRTTDVPIISSSACQTSLQSTRLGSAFLLDRSSFICAGGEENKDACTGDGGSGLVCEVSSGRWVLAGLVAWGIGCASKNVPAAYVNIPNYIDWIQSKQSQ